MKITFNCPLCHDQHTQLFRIESIVQTSTIQITMPEKATRTPDVENDRNTIYHEDGETTKIRYNCQNCGATFSKNDINRNLLKPNQPAQKQTEESPTIIKPKIPTKLTSKQFNRERNAPHSFHKDQNVAFLCPKCKRINLATSENELINCGQCNKQLSMKNAKIILENNPIFFNNN